MSEEPLSSVQDRFDRAQEHFESIKDLLRAYYAADLHVIYGDTNLQTRDTNRVLYAERPDERLHTIIGEMLHDLRSALDHLARVFVKTNGGDPTEHFYFPILSPSQMKPADANGVRPNVLSQCKSDDVRRFLDEIQPYQLGPMFYLDGLWILQRLAIIDRHMHIVPEHIGLGSINWSSPIGAAHDVEWDAHTIRSDENGAELEFRLKNPEPDVEGHAVLQIIVQQPGEAGIGNPDPVPLMRLLDGANDKTREVLTEARSRFF